MRVALIHDWLTGMRGGEKVLEVFCRLFPEATVFTLLHNKGSVSPAIEKMKIKTSFAQHLPKVYTHYRSYLPLFPMAIESFDLRGFDFILSSSHCVAKGVRVPKGIPHFAYCHTPMRYMW
ncbi:MAG TPA: glycosyltransferase family 4 protein, partial [Candidatus Margulisiibacteriota bacterium]|nr:glycosyltransferase family 4 protein [Candidatus Margulisiibacteriota bacterium]